MDRKPAEQGDTVERPGKTKNSSGDAELAEERRVLIRNIGPIPSLSLLSPELFTTEDTELHGVMIRNFLVLIPVPLDRMPILTFVEKSVAIHCVTFN